MSCEARSQQPRAWRTAAHWNRLLTVTPLAQGSPPGSAPRPFLSMNERVRGEKRAPTESAESPAQSRRRLRNDRRDTRTDRAGAGRPPPSALRLHPHFWRRLDGELRMVAGPQKCGARGPAPRLEREPQGG